MAGSRESGAGERVGSGWSVRWVFSQVKALESGEFVYAVEFVCASLRLCVWVNVVPAYAMNHWG